MKNCQCFCDTLVACSCDKVSQPTMMKPETNCFDFCITDSILGCIAQIALCAAAIIMVWILLKYITEWIKLRRERKKEEASQSEKFKKECQSKILEFMEKEMASCDKICQGFEKPKKNVDRLIEQVNGEIKKLQNNSEPDKDESVKKLVESVNKLDKTIKDTDLSKLKTSVEGLEAKMIDDKKFFANNTYLQVLNKFLKGENNLDDIFTKP